MSARIVFNGRVIAQSSYAGLTPIAHLALPINPRVPTIEEERQRERTASEHIDPKSGIAYEIKDRLDPREWVTADVLMGWYSASFDMVVAWVNHGRIAAAMERGSPTKRYRVRDPKYLLDDKVRRLSARRPKGVER